MEVQSQTAAVVHQDAQLLPLGTNTVFVVYTKADENDITASILSLW